MSLLAVSDYEDCFVRNCYILTEGVVNMKNNFKSLDPVSMFTQLHSSPSANLIPFCRGFFSFSFSV